MQRLIPRKTKVKLEFMRGITILDILLAAIGVAVAIILFLSNFSHHIIVAFVFAIIWVSLFFKVSEDERFTPLWYIYLDSLHRKRNFQSM